MLNSETLEVGIGMAFLFLLMSLICTGIKEWIEGILKWRAMDLECALRTLLDDESGKLTAYLFAHPLISSLYQGTYEPARLTEGVLPRGMANAAATVRGWLGLGAPGSHMALRARRNLPSYIPAAHFAKALIDLIGRGPADVDGENASAAPLTIAQLRDRAAALQSPFLRRAFLSALDHCQGNLEQLTENLQNWFDGSMDRASGWYKRRTQAVLFVLGLGAAGCLNVDALYVMGRLTADKAFRETVVSAAAKVEAPTAAASGLVAAERARKMLDDVAMPMGWRDDNTTPRWSFGIPVQQCKADNPATCENTRYSWMRVVLGWLVTAFAVMLGAPFWFDVLNKFMVIRSTVKPREKSREEGSEDRADPASKDKSDKTALTVAPAAPAAPVAAVEAQAAAQTVPEFVPRQWRDQQDRLGKEIPL